MVTICSTKQTFRQTFFSRRSSIFNFQIIIILNIGTFYITIIIITDIYDSFIYIVFFKYLYVSTKSTVGNT